MNNYLNRKAIIKISTFTLIMLIYFLLSIFLSGKSYIILSFSFSITIFIMYAYTVLKAEKLKKISAGKRTIATMLFVDIRNFTQISENMSPDEVSLILNEYFSQIEPIISKYRGFVNKYMGDGLFAVFSADADPSEQALNAVKCGIEILHTAKNLKEKLLSEGKPLINIGIGINTGEVFAGNIGADNHFEYTVIGDSVNLVFRIESFNHTLKTQFLISEYTYEYVKEHVDVVKLSQVSIKGKSKPIDIYEILRIKNNDRQLYKKY